MNEYEVKHNRPAVKKVTQKGVKIRLPFSLWVNGKHQSDHRTADAAMAQATKIRLKAAQDALELKRIEQMECGL
jgi:hypothetical protein